MNKFESLNKIIKQTIQEYDEEILEITTLEELYEISSMGGGAVQGHAAVDEDENLIRRVDEMISRKNIIIIRNLLLI